ncbi:hypothetical protein SAMN03159304_04762 [Pseudomonas sp. NFACC24-1]|uniref:hypothetical protein n=1 Tax=Pseudomonas sp. NFACC24-1 TaxID=1566189 RepID=UPI0008EF59B6|nr:hypothetical protein [Pseudomonas sp. NFACC24-1]SFO72283.1 hypothetical protein SAMN03159304_04762 [Pseudomonas sp. NFACC24-1]
MKQILWFIRPGQWANPDRVREQVIAEKGCVVVPTFSDRKTSNHSRIEQAGISTPKNAYRQNRITTSNPNRKPV